MLLLVLLLLLLFLLLLLLLAARNLRVKDAAWVVAVRVHEDCDVDVIVPNVAHFQVRRVGFTTHGGLILSMN